MQGLIDQQFVLPLILFEDIFRVTKFASNQLQSPNLDISSANDLIQSASQLYLKTFRRILERHTKPCKLCAKAGLALGSIPPQRRETRQQSQRIMDFIVEAPVHCAHTSDDDLCTDCFYQVLDRLISELTRHFSKDADDMMMGSQLSANNTSHS